MVHCLGYLHRGLQKIYKEGRVGMKLILKEIEIEYDLKMGWFTWYKNGPFSALIKMFDYKMLLKKVG